MPSFGQNRKERLNDLVDAERDRRMLEPFMFNGMAYDFDPDSRDNISGAFALALAARVGGGGAEGDLYWHGGTDPFQFRSADNVNVPMDAPTVMAFGQAAASRKAALIFPAAAMKDAPVTPKDFADDQYWP